VSDRLLVQDAMTADVLTVTPEQSVATAAERMSARGVRALPVVNDSGEVVGLITDQEVMDRCLPWIGVRFEAGSVKEALHSLESTPARELMQRRVLCVNQDQVLHEVAALMIHKDIERCPVVADGALVGILTRGDILRRLLTEMAREIE